MVVSFFDDDRAALRTITLVSRAWVPSCRARRFRVVRCQSQACAERFAELTGAYPFVQSLTLVNTHARTMAPLISNLPDVRELCIDGVEESLSFLDTSNGSLACITSMRLVKDIRLENCAFASNMDVLALLVRASAIEKLALHSVTITSQVGYGIQETLYSSNVERELGLRSDSRCFPLQHLELSNAADMATSPVFPRFFGRQSPRIITFEILHPSDGLGLQNMCSAFGERTEELRIWVDCPPLPSSTLELPFLMPSNLRKALPLTEPHAHSIFMPLLKRVRIGILNPPTMRAAGSLDIALSILSSLKSTHVESLELNLCGLVTACLADTTHFFSWTANSGTLRKCRTSLGLSSPVDILLPAQHERWIFAKAKRLPGLRELETDGTARLVFVLPRRSAESLCPPSH